MFRRDAGQGWSVVRVADATMAILLVFLGAMLALWGIRLAVDGAQGMGITITSLGAVLAFTGTGLARGTWDPHHTHGRHRPRPHLRG